MSATQTPTQFALNLTEEEHRELLYLLEDALVDVHSERRRTEAPDYQVRIAREESLIRSLTEKVRALRR